MSIAIRNKQWQVPLRPVAGSVGTGLSGHPLPLKDRVPGAVNHQR